MHSYTNEHAPRWKIIGLIAFASWPLHYWASGAIEFLSQWAGLSLTVPSVLTMFYGVFWIFKNYLWRVGAWAGLLNVVDLCGTWEGILRTSYEDFGEGRSFTLHIEQEWNRISVKAKTNSSRSESTSALLKSDRSGSELTYTYRNRPNPSAEDSMATHEGTAKLRLEGDNRLVGRYYTGEQRGYHGEIEVTRQSWSSWLSV